MATQLKKKKWKHLLENKVLQTASLAWLPTYLNNCVTFCQTYPGWLARKISALFFLPFTCLITSWVSHDSAAWVGSRGLRSKNPRKTGVLRCTSDVSLGTTLHEHTDLILNYCKILLSHLSLKPPYLKTAVPMCKFLSVWHVSQRGADLWLTLSLL